MSTAIQIRDGQDEFDDRQVAVLRSLGVEKAQRADLALFFHVCQRTGLDPFARQIYLIERWTKDGPKQTIQTGIDGLRLVAQRTAERRDEALAYEDTLWCGADGQWHDVWLSDEPPSAAKVTIVRNGQRFPSVALMKEYAQTTKNGGLTKMWADKSALMLAKCAEAGALRKAFPQDLSGLYTSDEMDGGAAARRPRQQAAPQFTQEPQAAPEVDAATGEVLNDQPEPDDGLLVQEEAK